MLIYFARYITKNAEQTKYAYIIYIHFIPTSRGRSEISKNVQVELVQPVQSNWYDVNQHNSSPGSFCRCPRVLLTGTVSHVTCVPCMSFPKYSGRPNLPYPFNSWRSTVNLMGSAMCLQSGRAHVAHFQVRLAYWNYTISVAEPGYGERGAPTHPSQACGGCATQ